MAIPDYQTIMLPLLKLAADQKEHAINDVSEQLEDKFDLSEADKKQFLPSGRQRVFRNRVGWARVYLVKAELLESTRRGFFRITERGLKLLAEKPKGINYKLLLEKYPEFEAFWKAPTGPIPTAQTATTETVSVETPEETLEYAYQRIRQNLAQDLLTLVMESSPSFFEKLVVQLLVKMGYGGSIKDAGEAVGGTADGGIDGIIKEDRLGLDVIYIQAKRWQGTVDRTEVHKFAGALQGQRAKKGIFITTSRFSNGALDYLKTIETKIIPIDGGELAQLMIDYDIGVTPTARYETKRIDSDYFAEE